MLDAGWGVENAFAGVEVLTSPEAGGGLSLAGGVQFALSDCSEFVRSETVSGVEELTDIGGSAVGSGSGISAGEEGTDIGVAAAAVWLNRALRWDAVARSDVKDRAKMEKKEPRR